MYEKTKTTYVFIDLHHPVKGRIRTTVKVTPEELLYLAKATAPSFELTLDKEREMVQYFYFKPVFLTVPKGNE